jgi:hypothetical protein
MKTNETLIKDIWKKYYDKAPTKAQVSAILKKAKTQWLKSKKEFKLGTMVSWWTRLYVFKKSKK